MIVKNKTLLLMIIFYIGSQMIYSQDNGEEVPDRFHNFIFGDSLEATKSKLETDSFFSYRGDPDVSMMLEPDRSIIDTAGSGFIERAFFLFLKEKLYQITIVMNQELLDFYTLQTDFTSKYGYPSSLDPSGMIWENQKYRISLEYPLTVKYIDLTVFNAILEESENRITEEEVLRKDFLDTF